MELAIDGCYQLSAQSQCPFAHTSLCRHEKVKVRINDTLIINSTEIRETYRECCNGSYQDCSSVVCRNGIVNNFLQEHWQLFIHLFWKCRQFTLVFYPFSRFSILDIWINGYLATFQRNTHLLSHVEKCGNGDALPFTLQAIRILLVSLRILIVVMKFAEPMEIYSTAFTTTISYGKTQVNPIIIKWGNIYVQTFNFTDHSVDVFFHIAIYDG